MWTFQRFSQRRTVTGLRSSQPFGFEVLGKNEPGQSFAAARSILQTAASCDVPALGHHALGTPAAPRRRLLDLVACECCLASSP